MRRRLVLLLLAACSSPPQNGWTPFNNPANRAHPERARDADIHHYEIRLKVLLEDRKLEGRARITLTPVADVVRLDAESMTIHEVTSDGPLRFEHMDGTLTVHLTRTGRQNLAIRYTAAPKKGFVFILPDDGYPDKPTMAYSDGQPEDNHHWFPCYDNPNDRMTSETIVTAPSKFQVISNGRRLGRTEKDGWATTHWRLDAEHVTYLVSVIVGEFDSYGDAWGYTPVDYHVAKGLYTEADVRRCLGMTPDMMEYFSAKIGRPYPWPKYAQTLVWEYGGGMENTSATTMYQELVHPERVAPHTYEEGLIAHELAHQWFGDLLTCRTWAHLWLNEGFATYFEWLWCEHRYGRDRMRAEMYGWQTSYGLESYLGEAEGYKRPVVCDVYTQPWDMFDSHTYDRGGWVLHMLRDVLGDEKWWKGIAHYVKKHAGGLVTTKDFHEAMEEATGEELDWFFEQWLFKTGYPEFEVSHRYENGKLILTVDQRQEPTSVRNGALATGTPAVFKTPVDIEIDGTIHRVWIDERHEEFTFESGVEPRVLSFDRTGSILKKITWKKTTHELIQQLMGDPEAVGRVWAAGQLASKGAPDEIVEALAGAGRDPIVGVRLAAAKALGTIGTDAAAEGLLKNLGSEKDADVRRTILRALDGYATRESVRAALLKSMENETTPWCRTAAAISLGRAGGFDEILAFYRKNISDAYIVPGAVEALARTGDERAWPVLFENLKYGAFPSARSVALREITGRLEKERNEEAYRKVIPLVEDRSKEIRRAAIEWLGDHGDARALVALVTRAESDDDPAIRDAIDRIKDRLK